MEGQALGSLSNLQQLVLMPERWKKKREKELFDKLNGIGKGAAAPEPLSRPPHQKLRLVSGLGETPLPPPNRALQRQPSARIPNRAGRQQRGAAT